MNNLIEIYFRVLDSGQRPACCPACDASDHKGCYGRAYGHNCGCVRCVPRSQFEDVLKEMRAVGTFIAFWPAVPPDGSAVYFDGLPGHWLVVRQQWQGFKMKHKPADLKRVHIDLRLIIWGQSEWGAESNA